MSQNLAPVFEDVDRFDHPAHRLDGPRAAETLEQFVAGVVRLQVRDRGRVRRLLAFREPAGPIKEALDDGAIGLCFPVDLSVDCPRRRVVSPRRVSPRPVSAHRRHGFDELLYVVGCSCR
jgi:hypothetical protein